VPEFGQSNREIDFSGRENKGEDERRQRDKTRGDQSEKKNRAEHKSLRSRKHKSRANRDSSQKSKSKSRFSNNLVLT
jgi:hypothetical protein